MGSGLVAKDVLGVVRGEVYRRSHHATSSHVAVLSSLSPLTTVTTCTSLATLAPCYSIYENYATTINVATIQGVAIHTNTITTHKVGSRAELLELRWCCPSMISAQPLLR
ncbi:hypothetical protein E2562_034749 [Oryza meyeriana var. granulata]|uniref:Uncharacterized protein n=1 Tax=Oryza meyeriana var. granulata TaxID=110450 RepID=A0A6G1CWF4_9ORYZ|nr:hypothetical protein E2562_034749 [Oryza meyeriana var. granulata]